MFLLLPSLSQSHSGCKIIVVKLESGIFGYPGSANGHGMVSGHRCGAGTLLSLSGQRERNTGPQVDTGNSPVDYQHSAVVSLL